MQTRNSEHRVLLCDDQEIVAVALKQMLHDKDGIVCMHVASQAALFEALHSFKPTVLLLDLILPEANGIQITKQLRADKNIPHIPIVLLSSADEAQVKADAFIAGVNDYLVKFPNAVELVARVTYHSQAFMDHQANIKARSESEQRSRVEALGTLAAGIAHEINTPLQYVTANLEYVLTSIESATVESEVPAALKDALQGVQQISSIVRAMKAFAHPGREEHVTVKVHELLSDVALLSRNEWKDVARLEVAPIPEGLTVTGSPGALSQVLINLVVNAAQAIRDNKIAAGLISLRASNHNNTLLIEVEDNGGGIPLEVQGKIFDPFFTTKDRGEGSGQGLTISRSLIEETHQGKLSFESSPGKGTTFKIDLPLSSTQPHVAHEATH